MMRGRRFIRRPRIHAFPMPNQFRRAIAERSWLKARVSAIAGGIWI